MADGNPMAKIHEMLGRMHQEKMARVSGGKSLTGEIACYVAKQRFQDLPASVATRIKELILDTIGCALGGFATESGPVMVAFGRDMGGPREATIIGDGHKISCAYAASVNGYLANRLDFDETSINGHIGAPIVTVALALGEKLGRNGQDIINAVAAGYEAGSRVGSLTFTAFLVPEFQRNSSNPHWYAFGPALAAAKLLDLTEDQVRETINIVITQPAAMNSCFIPDATYHVPNMLKSPNIAACQLGIEAAYLAKNGFVGSTNVLDHDMTPILDVPYSDYWFTTENLEFKPWSVCRYIHGGIEIVLDLMKKNGIKAQDIEEVRVGTFLWASAPPYDSMNIEYWNDVTWSIPCGIALSVLGYEPGPDWYQPSNYNHPEVRRLMQKIKVYELPEATASFAAGRGIENLITKVTLEARGQTFSQQVRGYKGDPTKALSQAELEAKFLSLARHTISEVRARKIIRLTNQMETQESLKGLMALTRPSQR